MYFMKFRIVKCTEWLIVLIVQLPFWGKDYDVEEASIQPELELSESDSTSVTAAPSVTVTARIQPRSLKS